MSTNRIAATMMMLTAVMTGCTTDERVAHVAIEAADRQAQQNAEMARVTSQASEGNSKLIEADAEARKEIVRVHRDLQAERTQLSEQWNQLENERQDIAGDRRTESLVVPAVKTLGAIAVAVLAIGFCLVLLFGLRKSDDTDAQLGELLIHEIVGDQPRLLPPRDVPALPTCDGSETSSHRPPGDPDRGLDGLHN
jgi:hypothetical protein